MRVILIDAANLAYRAHHVAGYLQTSTTKLGLDKGFKTGVIFSFLRMLKSLQSKFNNAAVIVLWEAGVLKVERDGKTYEVNSDMAPTWRKTIPGFTTKQSYKANREKITKDRLAVHAQIPLIQKALAYLRHPQYSVPRLEGDDLIGILAYKLSQMPSVKSVAIVSSDKDFFQCISDVVSVYRPEKSNSGSSVLKQYTAELVKLRYSVHPDQWAAYKALVGDSTDHYEGIKGIGPAAAIKLLSLGADPSLPWEVQPMQVRVEFKKLKSVWKYAIDCYKLSLIPTSTRHKYFPKDAAEAATDLLRGFHKSLVREFTTQELKASMELFTRFCARYELHDIIANRRSYFVGARVDGRILE